MKFSKMLEGNFINYDEIKPFSKELKAAYENVFKGKEGSKRPFHDWFFGCPYFAKDHKGDPLEYHNEKKLYRWLFFVFGGFLICPLYNILKIFTQFPLNVIEKLCRQAHSHFYHKIKENRGPKKYLWGSAAVFTGILITGPSWILATLARTCIVRPFLAPRDSILAAINIDGRIGRYLQIASFFMSFETYCFPFLLFCPPAYLALCFMAVFGGAILKIVAKKCFECLPEKCKEDIISRSKEITEEKRQEQTETEEEKASQVKDKRSNAAIRILKFAIWHVMPRKVCLELAKDKRFDGCRIS